MLICLVVILMMLIFILEHIVVFMIIMEVEGIDWQDEVLALLALQNHNVNITGGTEKTKNT